MPTVNEAKNKGVSLLDLILTGEASRICGVDRRTFFAKARKYKVKEVGKPGGRSVYYRKDIEFLARKILEEKREKEIGG